MKLKLLFLFCAGFFLICTAPHLAAQIQGGGGGAPSEQSGGVAYPEQPGSGSKTDTITITTYYPAPYGVYGELQVHGKLAVGDFRSDPSVQTMSALHDQQLYVANSTMLRALDADPDPSDSIEGQVIYNDPDNMLKFFNGTEWVNATGNAPICGSSNGKLFTAAPSTNLCAAGNPTAVSGYGPWTWNCTMGSGVAPCSAYLCNAVLHYPNKHCWEGTIVPPNACNPRAIDNGCDTGTSYLQPAKCNWDSYYLDNANSECNWEPIVRTCVSDEPDYTACIVQP